MEKNTKKKTSNIQQKPKKQEQQAAVIEAPEMSVMTVQADKIGEEEDRELTFEEMKKDPQYVSQVRSIAAAIDSAMPNKWVNYQKYTRRIQRGMSYEMFLNLANTLREFDFAVVKQDSTSKEFKFKIDFSKKEELRLIEEDIQVYESQLARLRERKKVVEKIIEENEDDK